MKKIFQYISKFTGFYRENSPLEKIILSLVSVCVVVIAVLIFVKLHQANDNKYIVGDKNTQISSLSGSPPAEVLKFKEELLHTLSHNHDKLIQSKIVESGLMPDIWSLELIFETLNRDIIGETIATLAEKRNLIVENKPMETQSLLIHPQKKALVLKKGEVVFISIVIEAKKERFYEENIAPVGQSDQALYNIQEGVLGDDHSKIVLILDDFGYDFKKLKLFSELNNDITFSVLPLLKNTKKIVSYLSSRNQDYMMHMPMQPIGWPEVDPGPGFLSVNDSSDDIMLKIQQALEDFGQVGGINNHMGSLFSTSEKSMDIFIAFLSQKKMYYIDSKTASGTENRALAKKYRIPFAERDVFLDNVVKENEIKKQLRKALNISRKKGLSIVIGHPFIETYNVLKEELPKFSSYNVKLIRAREIFSSQ